MNIIDGPKVYLVSYPKFDDVAANTYLEDIGADKYEFDEALDAAEELVRFGGKLCYRSWQAGLNPNVTRTRDDGQQYIRDGIIKTGHGSVLEHAQFSFILHDVSRVLCYSPEAELLTSRGWKPVAEITTKDRLLTMNPRTRKAEWAHPESVHAFQYEGDLFSWQNSQFACPGVTMDHLMWAAPHDLRRARGLSNEENIARFGAKIPAKDLVDKRFAVDLGIRRDVPDRGEDLKIGDFTYNEADLLAWLGWMATDGGFSQERPNKCAIGQSKQHNIGLIRELMERLFGDRANVYGPYSENDQTIFTVHDADLAEFARSVLGPNKLERRFNLEFFFDRAHTALEAFYQAVLAGDGTVHHSNGSEAVYCPSQTAAGELQAIIACTGRSANVRTDDRVGESHEINGVEATNTIPCYVVAVSKKTASLVKREKQKLTPYDGLVYCPKTEHGLVFVRGADHGLPFWCGNTHEWVRHRVGVAISQESLRYVRLTDLKFWIPEILKKYDNESGDGVKLVLETVEYLENQQKRLAEIYAIDDIKDFDTKKKLTSAFRRIAPIGLATGMLWSANLRTLRHVIQMRSDVHAEEEARLVADQIATLIKAKCPSVFADLERSEDGTWKSEHPANPYDKR